MRTQAIDQSPRPVPSCYPRKRFTDRRACEVAAMRIAQGKGVQRLPEPCGKCNGWHLSGVMS